MRICVPTGDDRGLESEPFGHFGSAPYFTLVDTETGSLEVVANDNRHHAHGACHPMVQLASHSIHAVVCGGMGRRAVAALREEGITVLISDRPTVGEVLRGCREGTLRPLGPDEACGGRGPGRHHREGP